MDALTQTDVARRILSKPVIPQIFAPDLSVNQGTRLSGPKQALSAAVWQTSSLSPCGLNWM